jgi:hypothetical protein
MRWGGWQEQHLDVILDISQYCTISTDHSRGVTCDAHSSLEVMFATQCDA